jgi:hypothetical protein
METLEKKLQELLELMKSIDSEERLVLAKNGQWKIVSTSRKPSSSLKSKAAKIALAASLLAAPSSKPTPTPTPAATTAPAAASGFGPSVESIETLADN